jgi:hypothetical protein
MRSPQVQHAVRKAARERRIEQVRPGWWVFSHDLGGFGMGVWDEVTSTASTLDRATRRTVVTVTVRSSRTGRPAVIEAPSGVGAWCCTRAEARRAGLDPT